MSLFPTGNFMSLCRSGAPPQRSCRSSFRPATAFLATRRFQMRAEPRGVERSARASLLKFTVTAQSGLGQAAGYVRQDRQDVQRRSGYCGGGAARHAAAGFRHARRLMTARPASRHCRVRQNGRRPAATPHAGVPCDLAPLVHPPLAMRILFVEDQRIFAETVAAQFLSAHHVVITESIAAARAALLVDAPYDVALVDYDLPDGKGTALVRHLRTSGFRGRIIAVSAKDDGNRELRAAGAHHTCKKTELQRIAGILTSTSSR
jgi:CheY-like chemotaxis protein